MSDTEFHFEHTLSVDRKLYVELQRSAPAYRPLKLAGIAFAGVACLLWSYTFVLGLVVLALAVFAAFVPHLLPSNAAHVYERHRPYLARPMRYGFDQSSMWVRGDNVEQKCAWQNLAVWELRDDWLRLAPHGSIELYFPVDSLRSAGVLDRVVERCRAHGTEFDNPRPQAA